MTGVQTCDLPIWGKEPAFLQRAPGLSLLATVGIGPIRGEWTFGDYGYVVSGPTLYQIDNNWNAVAKGTVAGTGSVSMADNGTQLFIAANPQGYIYNAQTDVFQQITDPDFPGAVTVSYLDGYFVFNQPDSQKIWVTSLYDANQIDALDFASSEGSPDGTVGLIVDHREVWVFGTDSTEVWYNAGNADFPLARIQGAFNEIGCVAPYSIAKLDNGIFWLGTDARGQGIVYRANGYIGIQAYIASTPERTAALTKLRIALRDATGRATTVGIGPRFLHSTGQLHKGGAPIGWTSPWFPLCRHICSSSCMTSVLSFCKRLQNIRVAHGSWQITKHPTICHLPACST